MIFGTVNLGMIKKVGKEIKKSFQIEEECNGKSVSPVGKKERKPDLTQEIKKLLYEPVTLDSIKRILILMYYRNSEHTIQKSEIEVYTPSKSRGHNRKFIITVYIKNTSVTYFLDSWGIDRLCNFPGGKIKLSDLKREFCHAAYEYLQNNIKHPSSDIESQ